MCVSVYPGFWPCQMVYLNNVIYGGGLGPHSIICPLEKLKTETQSVAMGTFLASMSNTHQIPGHQGSREVLCLVTLYKCFHTLLLREWSAVYRTSLRENSWNGGWVFLDSVLHASCLYWVQSLFFHSSKPYHHISISITAFLSSSRETLT